MKGRYFFLMISFFLACAAGQQGLKDPTSNETMLIIGRVIVEDRGFTDLRKVYKKNIDVAVMGMTDEGKRTGFWASTDQQGYFLISNVPKGKYALKGVRLSVGRGNLITITNRLSYTSDSYMWQYKTNIVFKGSYFPIQPSGRIINLKNTFFSLDFSNKRLPQVKAFNNDELDNIKLINGEVLNAGKVEAYFIQKYPESKWICELEESAKTVK